MLKKSLESLKMSIKHSVFTPYGAIDGTSLTGSYQTVLTPGNDLCSIYLLSSCDKPIIVSLDGGVTDHFKLDNDGLVFDGRTNSKHIRNPVIKAKHAGVVPTTGSIRVTGVFA